ncbi:MAG: NADH-quinone oxidoreductase subunit C [Anaerolineales bacterium]|jgi:Ni,Fe-hydrogenase III component G
MNTEEILTLAATIVSSWDWATEVSRPNPKQLDVKVKQLEELVPIVVALRVKRLGHLVAIVCLDLGPAANEMEVLYDFCPGDAVITLRVRIPREGGVLPSLCEIIPGAESFERELREMFGIEMTGLHTPDRLYLPDDWPDGVYPMRKDFDPKVLSTSSLQEKDS